MRAIGLGTGSFMGARVAGRDGSLAMTYIPSHTKNGKSINQRCIIPIYINSNKGTNRDGTPGRSDRFRLVAWGKLADICAKSLTKGKALDCVYKPHSYEGRIYDANGNIRVDNTGQPITVERIGFTITEIIFGEDSQKEIDKEIAEGRRPINWNNSTHPDHQSWITILQSKQAILYTPGMAAFGQARVVVASGPGIVADVQATTGVQPNTVPAAAVGVDPNQLATLIQQALASQQAAPQPVTPPAVLVDANGVAIQTPPTAFSPPVGQTPF